LLKAKYVSFKILATQHLTIIESCISFKQSEIFFLSEWELRNDHSKWL